MLLGKSDRHDQVCGVIVIDVDGGNSSAGVLPDDNSVGGQPSQDIQQVFRIDAEDDIVPGFAESVNAFINVPVLRGLADDQTIIDLQPQSAAFREEHCALNRVTELGSIHCDDDPWEKYYVRRELPDNRVIPVGCVLTMVGTGSEMNGGAVITNHETKQKIGHVFGTEVMPKFTILNPEFTFTLPAYQTACGATDMFAHVVERYFTPTRDVAVSDELCEGLMRTIVAESRKALSAPRDYAARANLMWAGSLAHNNVCGAGRAQDWASHGIEHELSALYGCAHGAGLAVVMPAWMDYVKDVDIPRFARFAAKVFGVPEGEPAAMAAEGIRRYRAWLRDLGMPLTFAELGAKKEDIPALVAKLGLNGNTVGTFKPLAEADVTRILESCCA